jgi:hypothetical protein
VIAAHHARKAAAVTRDTARLRALCDHLVWDMFADAERAIDTHAALRLAWVVIRLPQTCDDDMRVRWAEVIAYGATRGYTQFRPGSPAGHGCDFVRLERPLEAAAPWPTPDDITEDVA